MRTSTVVLVALPLLVACGSRSDLIDSPDASSGGARPPLKAGTAEDASATLGAAEKLIGALGTIIAESASREDPACIGKQRGTPCGACASNPSDCGSNSALVCNGQGACVTPLNGGAVHNVVVAK